MGLLYILSYFAAIVAFIFVVLSLASGLLWLAELVEEHSRTAKTIGQRAIWVIIALHIILYFDGLPLPYLLFSIICHVVYSQNITPRWPIISLTSPTFIVTCILVLVDHFLWFNYFSKQSDIAKQRSKSYNYRGAGSYGKNRGLHDGVRDRGFGEVSTFFAICVWAVPLFLFLSLSANDNALPIQQENTNVASASRTSLLRKILDPVLSLLPLKRKSEPLIAPSTPNLYPLSPYFVAPQAQAPIPPPPRSPSPYPGAGGALSPGLRVNSPTASVGEGWANVPSAYGNVGLGIGAPPPPRVRRQVGKPASGERGKDD